MRQLSTFFCSILLLLCNLAAAANSISFLSAGAYKTADGPSAVSANLSVYTTGSEVRFQTSVRRNTGSQDQAGVAVYIDAYNTTPVGRLIPVQNMLLNGGEISTANNTANGAVWVYGSPQESLNLNQNPYYKVNISSSSPGVVTNASHRIIIALYDLSSKVIFDYLPITLSFTTPPAGTPVPAPVLSTISPSSAAAGAIITLTGSGFNNAYTVDFNGGGTPRANFTVVSDTKITIAVPADADSGPLTVTNVSYRASNAIYFTVIPPSNPPTLTRIYGVAPVTHTQGVYDDAITPNGLALLSISPGAALRKYDIIGVNMNGIIVPSSDFLYSGNFSIQIPVPAGATPGLVYLITRSLGNSNAIRYYFPRPQYPCPGSSAEICGDQCVTYGNTPSTILGRLVANKSGYTRTVGDAWTMYKYYSSNVKYYTEPIFATDDEYEEAQWQFSYTNNGTDWQNIAGAIERDYQPGPTTRTTYYRRSSTHRITGRWLGSDYTEHWYDSNVVTVNVIPPAPSFVSSSYNSCGNGSVIKIALNPVQGAVSYNWWIPYQGWEMSTDGQNFTPFNGGSFIVPSTEIYVRVPASATAGSYGIAASSNGPNGWTPYGSGLCDKSPDGTTTINVTPGGSAVGQPTRLIATRMSSGCDTYYTVSMPVVAGATSYQATLDGATAAGYVSGSTVYFPHTYYPDCGSAYSVSGTVTASGSCNSVTVAASVYINLLKGCGACRVATPDTVLATAPDSVQIATTSSALDAAVAHTKQPEQLGVYPNPANDELHLRFGGKEVLVRLYAVTGALVRELPVKEGDTDTTLNVRDLPQGLYHLQVVQRDGRTESHKITITH